MVSCEQRMTALAISIVLIVFVIAGLLFTFSILWDRQNLAIIGIFPLVTGILLASYVGMFMSFRDKSETLET